MATYNETLANGNGKEHIIEGDASGNGQMFQLEEGVNGSEQW